MMILDSGLLFLGHPVQLITVGVREMFVFKYAN